MPLGLFPFAEISTHLDILLEHIAEAKADQLCQFYDLPPHEAKAYELNQIRRKLCFTCHQAIARQLALRGTRSSGR